MKKKFKKNGVILIYLKKEYKAGWVESFCLFYFLLCFLLVFSEDSSNAFVSFSIISESFFLASLSSTTSAFKLANSPNVVSNFCKISVIDLCMNCSSGSSLSFFLSINEGIVTCEKRRLDDLSLSNSLSLGRLGASAPEGVDWSCGGVVVSMSSLAPEKNKKCEV